jgi:hypothetical protein
MRLRPFAEALIGRRAVRLLAGFLALLLLLPVPAMALTFTGSWMASVSGSGAPTPPAPTFNDVTTGQQDDLFVDMGSYQGGSQKGRGSAVSTIDLTRTFSITAASQSVEFEHDLLAVFQKGGAVVTASVKNSAGQTVATPIQYSAENRSNKPRNLTDFQQQFAQLGRGNYTLDVHVQYFTNNKIGGWTSISGFHRFEFLGQ